MICYMPKNGMPTILALAIFQLRNLYNTLNFQRRSRYFTKQTPILNSKLTSRVLPSVHTLLPFSLEPLHCFVSNEVDTKLLGYCFQLLFGLRCLPRLGSIRGC